MDEEQTTKGSRLCHTKHWAVKTEYMSTEFSMCRKESSLWWLQNTGNCTVASRSQSSPRARLDWIVLYLVPWSRGQGTVKCNDLNSRRVSQCPARVHSTGSQSLPPFHLYIPSVWLRMGPRKCYRVMTDIPWFKTRNILELIFLYGEISIWCV